MITALLAGCSNGKSYDKELLQAEQYYLEMDTSKAESVLKSLEGNEDLPDRYYELKVKLDMRSFHFAKAFQSALKWQKKGAAAAQGWVSRILKAQLRYFSEFRDKSIRFDAIKALGEVKDKEASEFIRSHFQAKSRSIRLAVCYAMCYLGDLDVALPYLVERARFSSFKSRFLAALLLSKIDNRDLAVHFQELLKDPEMAIKALSVRHLGNIKYFPAMDSLKAVYESTSSKYLKLLISQSLVKLGESSYKENLKKALKSKTTKRAAMLMLYELGDSSFKGELLESFGEFSHEEQYAFLKGMILSGDVKEARSHISNILQSIVGDVLQKKMALELLSEYGSAEDLPLIVAQISSPFEQVQISAARAYLILKNSEKLK
jgi:HEAT repeat protein